MLALWSARTKVVVAGALALAGCSASGAAVTRAGAPAASSVPAAAPSSPPASVPAATDPAVTPAAALATTPDPTATTAPAPPPTTAAPPPPTEPPTTTTTAQSGPLLEVAAPLAAPLTAVGPSSSGAEVSALQQRLLDLGYWVADTGGHYDWVTQQAVMAFQK